MKPHGKSQCEDLNNIFIETHVFFLRYRPKKFSFVGILNLFLISNLRGPGEFRPITLEKMISS